MTNKIKSIVFIILSVCILSSCTDNNYDLSNINTDQLNIGDSINAPLGYTNIPVTQLMHIDSLSIVQTDDDGNYSVTYRDSLSLSIPNIVIYPIAIATENISIPNIVGGIYLPVDLEIAIPTISSALDISPTNHVQQIDSIIMKAGTSIKLDFYLANIQTDIPEGGIANIKVEFPIGYRLSIAGATPGASVIGNVLNFTTQINSLLQATTVELNILSIAPKSDDQITYGGTLSFKAGTTISANSPVLSISGSTSELYFSSIYGQFTMNLSPPQLSILTNDLGDAFGGSGTRLSFQNPHIRMKSKSNFGFPLNASLAIVSETASEKSTLTIDNIEIAASTYPSDETQSNIWIGPIDPMNGDEFIKTDQFNDLINIAPDRFFLNLSANIPQTPNQFYYNPGYSEITYSLEVPFSPESDFKATSTQDINGIFDKDIVDYLFSSGSAVIYGLVNNSTPLDIAMTMYITDDNKQILFSAGTAQIAGSMDGSDVHSDIELKIDSVGMSLMPQAKNIHLVLVASSSEELAGAPLNDKQSFSLHLRLKKNGGIIINE